jgi:hypothetical protein
MLSHCVSLISTNVYAVVDFIRNSSQTGILLALGSVLFIFGTILRRRQPVVDEPVPPHTSMVWERSMPRAANLNAPAFTLQSRTAVSQPSAAWKQPVSLNTLVASDRVQPQQALGTD